MKKFIISIFMSIFILSACGPAPEPTPSAEEIQGTAVAAAFTMIAQTQAAIPTATPIPPTETLAPTPVPTNTIAPLPTVALPTATPETSNDDDCNHILASDAPGPTTTLRIDNRTKAPITVSIFLYKTVFGECGYRGYNITKNGDTVITFPQGTYWVTAILGAPINRTIGDGPFTTNNTDKYEFWINEDFIKFVGP